MDEDLTKIVDVIKRVGDISDLAPDADFYRSGIDSMKAMDVMLDLESEFGVSVPDDEFVKARTAQALLLLVRKLQSA